MKTCSNCKWFESAEATILRWKENGRSRGDAARVFYSRCHIDPEGYEVPPDNWCSKWEQGEEKPEPVENKAKA